MGKRIISLPSGRDIKRTGTGSAPIGVRVRKGDPKTDPKRPGADLDHFRFDVAEDEPSVPVKAVEQALIDLYGNEPRVIRGVFFYTPDPWSEVNEQWGVGKNDTPMVLRRCDGQTMSRCMTGDKISFDPLPCACQHEEKPKCKQTGRLVFWLPELCERVGSLFLCMLVTHGENDIANIGDTVDSMTERLGNAVKNVSFVLSRKPKPVVGGGMQVIKHMVYLYSEDKAAQLTAQSALNQGAAFALPAGNTEPQRFEVEVTHFYMRWTDSGAVEYRFKGADGRGYATFDTEIVRAVMPNILNDEPVTAPIAVPFPLWATVEGGTIIELVRGS